MEKKDLLKELDNLYHYYLNNINDRRIYHGNFNLLRSKQSEYKGIGYFQLAIGNIEEARYNFYKSAYVLCLLNDLFLGEKYPNITEKGSDWLLSGKNWYAESVLCAGDEQILRRYFKPLALLPDDYKNGYNTAAILIKKGLILKDEALVKEYLPLFQKMKVANLRGYEKGDYLCLKGILEHNMDIFNEGISLICKVFKRDEGVLVASYSLWATANIRLARRLGFEPDLSNRFISKDLVFMEDKTFEEDDELKSYLSQLDEMNTPDWEYNAELNERITLEKYKQEQKNKNDSKSWINKMFGK